MRKSIVAGLALSAAMTAFAGHSYAIEEKAPVIVLASLKDKEATPVKPVRHARKQPIQVAEPPRPLFRIPAHPVVRDCVHVFFPQCGRGYDGLNDGTFGRY